MNMKTSEAHPGGSEDYMLTLHVGLFQTQGWGLRDPLVSFGHTEPRRGCHMKFLLRKSAQLIGVASKQPLTCPHHFFLRCSDVRKVINRMHYAVTQTLFPYCMNEE